MLYFLHSRIVTWPARSRQYHPADYSFYFVFTQEYKKQLKDQLKIVENGIGIYKLFTIYDGLELQIENIKEIMLSLEGELDKKRFLIHAEEPNIIDELEKECINNSDDMTNFIYTRPVNSEINIIKKLQGLSEELGVHMCIAHTTTKGAIELIKEKARNENFILETCPHYLEFTNEFLKGEDGALYTVTPPLRDEENRLGLWQGILKGKISILSTDHCTFHKKYKENKNYKNVPCGVDGVQIRMIYLFSEGVLKRGLSIHDFVKLTSENSAKNYNLYPRKGCIDVGSDADIVLISEGETDCSLEFNKSNLDYTIYEGKKLRGKIQAVIKSGKLVYGGKEINAEEGSGTFIPTLL